MVLLIDNYDSFSYNLYQLIGQMNSDIQVIRNDQMSTEEIKKLAPTHIFLSPGPGRPEDAGICIKVITELGGKIPILGVCLGHQAIYRAYGGEVSYAKELMHGKQSVISLEEESPLFRGLKGELRVARYHSLAAVPGTLPKELQVIARTQDGEIMAISHKEYPIYGVQFHPESILTEEGYRIIENFLNVK